MKQVTITLLLITLFITSLLAGEEKEYIEQDWALGATMRTATIPFATTERTVASFVPLMFFRSEHFYLNGIEGGVWIHDSKRWKISGMARLRFFDIPAEYQNQIQGNNILMGAKFRYKPIKFTYTDFELLSDVYSHFLSNLRLGLAYKTENFNGQVFGELQFKSSSFNNYYYGLDQYDVGAGTEISAGYTVSYHAWRNLYLFSAGKVSLLDRNVRKMDIINRDVYGQVYLGLGFSNDRDRVRTSVLKNKTYLRVSHGWATPTDLAKIIRFNAKKDTANNQMTSIFYGYPLTDDLFGIPLDFYIHSGLVWHWANKYNGGSSQEVALGIKFYYTIPWPIRWRFGAAEGLSYVNKIPFVERTEMERKGYKPSNLLNYLDFSLDFNIGDIFGGKQFKKFWLGYGIHHRSAIFESAQQFGRISGGSNFQTAYLQWEF